MLRILLLTKTRGYYHTSIPALINAVTAFKFGIHATEDSSDLLSLPLYDAVILGQNTGEFLNEAELNTLRHFVENGGGVLGIHAATCGMVGNDLYREILGEAFDDHPQPQWGKITVEESSHYITSTLSLPQETSAPASASTYVPSLFSPGLNSFPWFDEFYNFKMHPKLFEERTILLSVDESTYSGGQHPQNHPLAWCHRVGNGRVFYTSLGHFDEAYSDKWFVEILYRAIEWITKRDT